MIDFYGWNTSNGRKVAILLEELEQPYRYHPVDINKGEQHQEWFTKLNPNTKIPVIVDKDESGDNQRAVFESGAIQTVAWATTFLLILGRGKGITKPSPEPIPTIQFSANWRAEQRS